MAVSDDRKEAVRERCEIVELIQRTVPLRRRGKVWTACCPFHEEKTPSFTVSPERQSYHCFGCGAHGDVFKWVMERDHVGFAEALGYLAEECGVELTRSSRSGGNAEMGRGRLRAALEFAEQRFARMLETPRGAGARRYLDERGINSDSRTSFRLGFAPDQPGGLLRPALQAGFSARTLAAAGLIKSHEPGREVDLFQGRLMIPIRDPMGRLVGFGGRLLPAEYLGTRVAGGGEASAEEPQRGGKYINSPETLLFKKGSLVYALDRLLAVRSGLPVADEDKKSAETVASTLPAGRWAALVEGYTDVIAAHQNGIPWVVAALGTALTEDHARLLRRHLDGVVLVFDGDRAGIEAALKSLPRLLEQGLGVRVLILPEMSDPAEFIEGAGAGEFLARVCAASSWLDFLDRQVRSRFRMGGGEQLGEAMDWMLGFLDGLDDLRRQPVYARIADICKVPEELVRRRAAARVNRSTRFTSERFNAAVRPRSWANSRRSTASARLAGGPSSRRARVGRRDPGSLDNPVLEEGREILPVGSYGDRRALRDVIEVLLAIPSLAALVLPDWPPERLTGILGGQASEELEVYAAIAVMRAEQGRVSLADLLDRCTAGNWLSALAMQTQSLELDEARQILDDACRRFARREWELEIQRLRGELARVVASGDETAIHRIQRELHGVMQLQKGVAPPNGRER